MKYRPAPKVKLTYKELEDENQRLQRRICQLEQITEQVSTALRTITETITALQS